MYGVTSTRFILFFTLFAVISACTTESGNDPAPSESDVDSDADTDTDTDADTDSDSDADTDSDSDADADSDSDADADSDSDTNTNSDSDTDTNASLDTDTGVNICNETVSPTHFVDGIPAYAQCALSLDGAIWSNDGVSTSTIQEGDDWVRTQWSAGYQCTEFASRYLKFHWNVMSVPNGNAGTWCDTAPPNGLMQTTDPVHGDIMVFAPGSCWADDVYGHVAVVDVVNETAESVEFVEQNAPGRRSCPISTAACFLHAIENQ